MYATARTVSLAGSVGHVVDVQVDVSAGLIAAVMVGRPDQAIAESRDRCRAAVQNSGFEWPTTRRVTILLSPADLPKRGSHFDLAIAIGVLIASDSKLAKEVSLEGLVFIGELTLDGRLRSVAGVLPMVMAARARGCKRVFVPEPQAAEAMMVEGVDVIGVRSLAQVMAALTGKTFPEAPPVEPPTAAPLLAWVEGSVGEQVDYADVFGMADARFGLEVAAAGGHHLMLSGPKATVLNKWVEARVALMAPKAPRRAVLYARLSKATGDTEETSGSIERQLEAGRQMAAAKGWKVVGEFTDDGVSATFNKPEQRKGWRALLDHPEVYDVVVIWKVDRLVRKTVDFLNVNERLQERGAAVAAVADPIDMTTPYGRAFATMAAVFAELEAETLSLRIREARRQIAKTGRALTGSQPYGWALGPNPDGPGKVVVQDTDRIDFVREMVRKAQEGETIYGISQWLTEVEAPLPGNSQKDRKSTAWRYVTVERILRHPILAGMTPYNPGHQSKTRGAEVLRDDRGLPVVDEAIAIMSVEDWRALIAKLDSRDSAQTKPWALRAKSSGLLSGLIYCGNEAKHTEPFRMYRTRRDGRDAFYCKSCHHLASNIEPFIIEKFLEMKGDWPRWSKVVDAYDGEAEELPAVEHRLLELDDLIREASDRDERNKLRDQQDALFDLRDELREKSGNLIEVWNESDHYFSELWANAGDDVEARREVLEDALERVLVRKPATPGHRGPNALQERLEFTWKRPEEVGPRPIG